MFSADIETPLVILMRLDRASGGVHWIHLINWFRKSKHLTLTSINEMQDRLLFSFYGPNTTEFSIGIAFSQKSFSFQWELSTVLGINLTTILGVADLSGMWVEETLEDLCSHVTTVYQQEKSKRFQRCIQWSSPTAVESTYSDATCEWHLATTPVLPYFLIRLFGFHNGYIVVILMFHFIVAFLKIAWNNFWAR